MASPVTTVRHGKTREQDISEVPNICAVASKPNHRINIDTRHPLLRVASHDTTNITISRERGRVDSIQCN